MLVAVAAPAEQYCALQRRYRVDTRPTRCSYCCSADWWHCWWSEGCCSALCCWLSLSCTVLLALSRAQCCWLSLVHCVAGSLSATVPLSVLSQVKSCSFVDCIPFAKRELPSYVRRLLKQHASMGGKYVIDAKTDVIDHVLSYV